VSSVAAWCEEPARTSLDCVALLDAWNSSADVGAVEDSAKRGAVVMVNGLVAPLAGERRVTSLWSSMSDWNRFDLEMVERTRARAADVASAILRGELGIIEGARLLSDMSSYLVEDWVSDPDFRVFGALDSETDHLPVGAQRELWDPDALRERDAAVARIERSASEAVFTACRNVVARFGGV
jgi:hypothetical protein